MHNIVHEAENQDMQVLLVCAMHLVRVFEQIIYLLCLHHARPPQEKVVIAVLLSSAQRIKHIKEKG